MWCLLCFVDGVEAADAEGELALCSILGDRIAKQSQERFTLWEAGDAVGEVGIGLAIASDAAAQPRDDMLGVEVVEGANERAVGSGQFEYHHAAAGLEDTQHLTEALLQMNEVADAESASDSIEFAFGEWQRFGVAQLKIEN